MHISLQTLQDAALGEPTMPKIGDHFTSLNPELDLDENDQERITPAGSIWRVTDLGNDYVSIVCDATGGWINPSPDQLTSEFRGYEVQ